MIKLGKNNFLFYNSKIDDVIKLLRTDINIGLSDFEVMRRREKDGFNLLPQKKKTSRLSLIISQFNSPLVFILIIAGIIMFFVGDWTDSLVIFLAVVVNAIFGYWEEHKSLNIMSKLAKVLVTRAKVLRGGNKSEIDQSELVVGDIVFLQAGDRVPADGRLLSVNNLKISEAVLTGEWMAVTKNNNKLSLETDLVKRTNMAFAGSMVESGIGVMVVVAIGVNTETGKIATMVKEIKEESSPLRKKLQHFGKVVGVLIGIIAVIIFIGGLLRGDDILIIFETAVAIAVGGVPEALPIVMTVILAIGMERLLRKKGLIRKLSAVETLGSTSVICFDKTKTLTEGKMAFASLITKQEDLTYQIAALCNEAFVEKGHADNLVVRGTSTDKAILLAAHERGFIKAELEKEFVELDRVPFDSNYKFQATLVEKGGGKYVYTIGAPERILDRSIKVDIDKKEIDRLTSHGWRVVGIAYKKADKQQNKLVVGDVDNLTFIGLMAFQDPLRRGIKTALSKARSAGLKPIIITGDYAVTAKNIASEAGLLIKDNEIVTGGDLDKMSDEDLMERCVDIKIYARSEPRHKIRIVKAWQRLGKVVAMVGDGVNDAPALKQADIGVSVGSGTEVAKETADLVLLNDSFSILIQAIEQGRVILDNLRKSIAYVMADSFTSVIIVGFATIVMGWPLPILPVQILWNNIVEDTLPNIAYAFEPGEKDVMKRKPLPVNIPLLTKEMKVMIFGTGLLDEIMTLALFWFLWEHVGADLEYVRTMIFGAISLDTAFVVYSYKNLRQNIWHINLFSNWWLIASSIVVFIAFSVAIYTPFWQRALHTVPLGLNSWLLLIAMGIMSVVIVELTKWYFIARHEVSD